MVQLLHDYFVIVVTTVLFVALKYLFLCTFEAMGCNPHYNNI
jgi:hypothetical protein